MKKVIDHYCDKIESEKWMSWLSDILSKKPLRELTPIFIRAFRDRISWILWKDLLSSYNLKKPFFSPSVIDQRRLLNLQNLFYSSLPESFFWIELSPISPLWLNSVISNISQDNSLSTIRWSEVISDPTTPLILECSNRRKDMLPNILTRDSTVKLATSHRVIRMQPFDPKKWYMQHFLLFWLCSWWREKNEDIFIFNNIKEHIENWIKFIDTLNQNNYTLNNITIKLSDIRVIEAIINNSSIPREKVNENSLNEDYDLFDDFNVDFPKESSSVDQINSEKFLKYRITHFFEYLKLIEKEIIIPLKTKYPNIDFTFDFNRKSWLWYYNKVCFHIYASDKNWRVVQLADWWSVDWIKKILNSNKEYAVTSWFGAELIHKLFFNN